LGKFLSANDIVILISLNFKKSESYYNRNNVAENPASTIHTENKYTINTTFKLEESVAKRPQN
jgi:hypothetical protein